MAYLFNAREKLAIILYAEYRWHPWFIGFPEIVKFEVDVGI